MSWTRAAVGIALLIALSFPQDLVVRERRWSETASAARFGFALDLAALAVGTATILVLFRSRGWVWPSAVVDVAPGGRIRIARGLWTARRKPVEAGTILQTVWARNVLGSRRRIKVEILASMSPAPLDEPPGTAFDVLVAVGCSVAPGTYLAIASAGSVKVRVKPGR
jgi:hypothetical protein